MTVGELLRKLMDLDLPSDTEVMIARGGWGPSRFHEAYLAVVRDQGEHHNWTVPFPELPDDPDNVPRLTVFLLE